MRVKSLGLRPTVQDQAQKVHVGIWHILRAERAPIYIVSGINKYVDINLYTIYHIDTWNLWESISLNPHNVQDQSLQDRPRHFVESFSEDAQTAAGCAAQATVKPS